MSRSPASTTFSWPSTRCPALTTVNIPRDRIGQLCFDALVREPAAAEFDRNILIEPELVVRESTGPAA